MRFLPMAWLRSWALVACTCAFGAACAGDADPAVVTARLRDSDVDPAWRADAARQLARLHALRAGPSDGTSNADATAAVLREVMANPHEELGLRVVCLDALLAVNTVSAWDAVSRLPLEADALGPAALMRLEEAVAAGHLPVQVQGVVVRCLLRLRARVDDQVDLNGHVLSLGCLLADVAQRPLDEVLVDVWSQASDVGTAADVLLQLHGPTRARALAVSAQASPEQAEACPWWSALAMLEPHLAEPVRGNEGGGRLAWLLAAAAEPLPGDPSSHCASGLALRHVAAWRHLCGKIPARTDLVERLLFSVSRRTHVPRRETHGPEGGELVTEDLANWLPRLSLADLVLLQKVDEALHLPATVASFHELAGQDALDASTELGGVLLVDGSFRAIPPLVRQHDASYQPRQELWLLLHQQGLAHVHLHAQQADNRDWAGPGEADLRMAARYRCPCLVVTPCGEDGINVDCLLPLAAGDVAVIDLGVFQP